MNETFAGIACGWLDRHAREYRLLKALAGL